MNYKKHIKTFSHCSYKKMGHLKGFSLHSQKDLNSGCLTVNVFLSLKKIPTQIYKLNCLTKVYTGHNILASYRLSRKFEVYNQNKKPVRKINGKKQQIELNKGKMNAMIASY